MPGGRRRVSLPGAKVRPERDRPGLTPGGFLGRRNPVKPPRCLHGHGGTPPGLPPGLSHLAALALLVVVAEADGRQAGQVEGGAEMGQQQDAGRQQPHLPASGGEGSMRRGGSPDSHPPGSALRRQPQPRRRPAAAASPQRWGRGACVLAGEAPGAILR